MVHICKNPFFHKGQGMLFDCGSCRACRLKRRGEWALRMQHESFTVSHKTLFVTLTYNAENLPKDLWTIYLSLPKILQAPEAQIGQKR